MNLYCGKCGISFLSEENNGKCPMCNNDMPIDISEMPEDLTLKLRLK